MAIDTMHVTAIVFIVNQTYGMLLMFIHCTVATLQRHPAEAFVHVHPQYAFTHNAPCVLTASFCTESSLSLM